MNKMFTIKHYLLLGVFILMTTFILQPSYFFYKDFKVGESYDYKVEAPKSITYIDQPATEDKKDAVLSQVQTQYDLDKSVYQETAGELDKFIKSVITYKNKIKAEKKVEQKDIIMNPLSYSNKEIQMFVNVPESELIRMNDIFSKELEKVFSSGITIENLQATKDEFEGNTNFYFFTKDVRDALVDKLKERLEPNLTINKERTNELKEAALEEVSPVYTKIAKGQYIVREGDKISEEQYEALKQLGLVKTGYHLQDILKQLPYILLTTVLFHLYCTRFFSKTFSSIRNYAFVLGLIMLVLLCSRFFQGTLGTFIPLLTALMIFVVFWGRQFVIFTSILLGFLLSGNDYIVLSLSIIAGIILATYFVEMKTRSDIAKTGLVVGIVLAISHIILAYSFDQLLQVKFALPMIVAGVIASIIALGSLSTVENFTGIITTVKLQELNGTSHPLIDELVQKANGTHSHSQAVGLLAERAASKIGANGLFLRIGALFHDVGKMENPSYFIENTEPGYNPHDFIEPRESAQIIRSHPLESVRLCRAQKGKHKIPEPIIKLIECHHSDSLLEHFYYEAKKRGHEVDKEDFRYQTPTPHTKEEGILLLADSVEAYSKTLNGKPKEELKVAIRQLIRKKMDAGDLRDCELTVKDIEICIEEFTEYIFNANHKRIKYVTEDTDKEESKQEPGV